MYRETTILFKKLLATIAGFAKASQDRSIPIDSGLLQAVKYKYRNPKSDISVFYDSRSEDWAARIPTLLRRRFR